MARYSVYVHEEALSSLPKSASRRRAVMDFIRKLGDDPFQQGDYAEQDDIGRQIEVKVVGRFAVSFQADHAAKEMKVVDIQFAD